MRVIAGLLLTTVVAMAQGVVPADVRASAIKAVEALGDQVVRGEHRVAIDRMYPQWKERMAERAGGLEKLERELDGVGALMARNGVSVISVKTRGEPRGYEVGPEGDDGGTKWLVLVPTLTQLRVLAAGDPPRDEVIRSLGFQVAIADKDTLDWTFINGSDVTVAELRSLFATLPANLELPPVRRERAE